MNGIALDASGNVYVADGQNNRVQKFDPIGAYVSQFGTAGSGNGQFSNPIGIAIDASGNIYVADLANSRVEKFDSTGAYVSQFGTFGSASGQFGAPAMIAIDATGNLYITDVSANRVEEFDSSGNYVTKWGKAGSGNGQFKFPVGIAFDHAGNIYVSDAQNSRIEKFIPTSGTFTESLSNLTCVTAYTYHAYAINSAGTGTGSNQTFTTAACSSAAPVLISIIPPVSMSTPASSGSQGGGSNSKGSGTNGSSDCTNGALFSTITGQKCSTENSKSTYQFVRTLKIGSTGDDVKHLQIFLNSHNAQVAVTGGGSPGHEGTIFGAKTVKALALFQKTNGITPSSGIFGLKTMKVVNSMLSAQ